MRRDEKFALAGLFGVVLAIALAFMAWRSVNNFVLSFRQEYAEHITREDTAAPARDQQLADLKAEHDRQLKVITTELNDIRLVLDEHNRVLAQRPDYAGFMNTDKELRRRVEQLELARWGGK